jgi:hypothetical protein
MLVKHIYIKNNIMSEEMRKLINEFNEIISDDSLLRVRRRLPENVYSKEIINESSLSRVYSHIKDHNCAIISAFRNQMVNCLNTPKSQRVMSLKDNKERSRGLKSALLLLGYSVTSVKGSYVENYLQDNAVEVIEDSYFVVNKYNDSNFEKNLTTLGVLFCQDSVMFIKDSGQDVYLKGTNNADYPGLGNIDVMGKVVFGKESEFMTKVGNKPFVIEDFKTLQNNSKNFVSRYGRPILEDIENFNMDI